MLFCQGVRGVPLRGTPSAALYPQHSCYRTSCWGLLISHRLRRFPASTHIRRIKSAAILILCTHSLSRTFGDSHPLHTSTQPSLRRFPLTLHTFAESNLRRFPLSPQWGYYLLTSHYQGLRFALPLAIHCPALTGLQSLQYEKSLGWLSQPPQTRG